MTNSPEAVLLAAKAPSPEQQAKLEEFLSRRYGTVIRLVFHEDPSMRGFLLEVGSDIYDFSAQGRFEQLKHAIDMVSAKDGNIIPLLRETIRNWTPKALAEEIGTVVSVGDGIATVQGMKNASYGEILLFASGTRGMVQNLNEHEIACILFDDDEGVTEGSPVKRSGRVAGIPVGEAMIGRVVGALGNPIDGKGEIEAKAYRRMESPAPSIIDRSPVTRPLETGILAIDSMFPIGRGQRELIIGDRQTGKTAIAIDTILNQKNKGVICIYVAIGQKASSIAQLVANLEKHGAMNYTIVVAATASEPAPVQYIAPYAGCAMGEYFMNKGRDVLIVYDDLSKHAVAYRSMSLLLGRSPGREAYPGDVFYLHSRLLERSAQLSESKGGGSMTALPIVETQAGDVSAYIPTNIISITDGQIFLESDLFFAGQRPAVNVGLSVSRVGGSAQTKAMKKATGTLRLDLAQYREMKIFTQFSSDLDEATRKRLIYGQGLMQLLKQEQYHPQRRHEQIILLTAALSHLFANIPSEDIRSCAGELLEYVAKNVPALCRSIDKAGKLSEEDQAKIVALSKAFLSEWEKR